MFEIEKNPYLIPANPIQHTFLVKPINNTHFYSRMNSIIKILKTHDKPRNYFVLYSRLKSSTEC